MHTAKPISKRLSRLHNNSHLSPRITGIRTDNHLSTRPISTTSSKMAFFPSALYNSDPSFTPLFRLLGDFESYSREMQGDQDTGAAGSRRRGHTRLITPKFDFRETKDTYELHGELPGIDRDNVAIEFTDPQTIVIRGRVERTYSAGTPPTGLLQGSDKSSAAITEGGEESHAHAHKATVEDEAAAAAKEKGADDAQVVKHKEKEQKQKEPGEKFWVSERSFGEFSRAFSLPARVDQDGVSAKLDNGILNVSIPKAKKMEARRIAIN